MQIELDQMKVKLLIHALKDRLLSFLLKHYQKWSGTPCDHIYKINASVHLEKTDQRSSIAISSAITGVDTPAQPHRSYYTGAELGTTLHQYNRLKMAA